MLQIGGNKFYNKKNKILITIPESKRFGIEIIAEFRGIPSGFPNQALKYDALSMHREYDTFSGRR